MGVRKALSLIDVPALSTPVAPPANEIHMFFDSVNGEPRVVDSSGIELAMAPHETLAFSQAGDLAVATGKMRLPIIGGVFRILDVAARVSTSPVGADLFVDINVNGTSIWTNSAWRLTVPSGSASGLATHGTFTTTDVAPGAYLTVDIDQVGSTTPGADLVVVLRMQMLRLS